MNLTIRILLPKDRAKLGRVEVISGDGEVMAGFDPPRWCLGLADRGDAKLHGNPERDPLKPYGNTCVGLYRVTVIPPGQNTHEYGSQRRLLLTPLRGTCVEAEANGRRGEEIHEGAENPNYPQWNFLRPTNGCVRVHQETLKLILAAIDKYSPVELTANITEAE